MWITPLTVTLASVCVVEGLALALIIFLVYKLVKGLGML